MRLLRDPELMTNRAAASSRRIDAFDWDIVGPQYLELYARA